MISLDDIRQWLDQFDREQLWIVKIFAIVFIALLVDFIQKRILRRIQKQLGKTRNRWDDALLLCRS